MSTCDWLQAAYFSRIDNGEGEVVIVHRDGYFDHEMSYFGTAERSPSNFTVPYRTVLHQSSCLLILSLLSSSKMLVPSAIPCRSMESHPLQRWRVRHHIKERLVDTPASDVEMEMQN
jgi:hypothetical protein